MKLVLFCDYGLDDAAATADVFSHALREGWEEVVLVAIGGNVPPDVALVNVRKLVAHLPDPGVKITLVDTTDEEQPSVFLKHIHGGDGMGDLFHAGGEDLPAVKYAAWLAAFSGEYDVLSLGPATLVLPLMERRSPRRLVLMGGNIAEEPNYHGYEFNHGMDREAFAGLVRFPHVAVTMDTCRCPVLNVQDCPPEGESVLARCVRRAREMTFVSGEKGCYIWDDLAVKALRHPAWFVCRERVDRDGNRVNVAEYTLGKAFGDIMLL